MATTIHDVAVYIADIKGSMSVFELHKMCYYAQAWHLAFYEKPLFLEPFVAWANGPVCPNLYEKHGKKSTITINDFPTGDVNNLLLEKKAHIDLVLTAYQNWDPHRLTALVQSEVPWREARRGVPHPLAHGGAEITHESMAQFYRALSTDLDAEILAG